MRPYFYAQKMGWYKQAGIDVDFETGRGSAASAQKVGAGASQLGLSDMAGVLLFRGKGARSRRADERLRQFAAGPLLAQELAASTDVKDLAGKKIGNPAGDGARTMWPALAKSERHRSELGDLGQHRRQCQARRAQGQDRRCDDVVLQPAPRVRARARRRHGLPGVEGRRHQPLRQLDHRQRRVAEGQPATRPTKFVKVTQKAFAECAKTPEPCVKALVEANGALLYDNELTTGISSPILMSDDTSRTVALGWHDDKRMADDYKLVDEYLKMEKPYDIKTAYTNEFLDKTVKMPPINPPKLY